MYEPFLFKEFAIYSTTDTYLYFICISVYILLAWLSSSIYSKKYGVKDEVAVFHFSFFGFLILPWIHKLVLKVIKIFIIYEFKPIPVKIIHYFAFIGYIYILLVFIKLLTDEWFFFTYYHMIDTPRWLFELTSKLKFTEWIF